eukprot:9303789-Prorocentrum_lima.AAC.1
MSGAVMTERCFASPRIASLCTAQLSSAQLSPACERQAPVPYRYDAHVELREVHLHQAWDLGWLEWEDLIFRKADSE